MKQALDSAGFPGSPVHAPLVRLHKLEVMARSTYRDVMEQYMTELLGEVKSSFHNDSGWTTLQRV